MFCQLAEDASIVSEKTEVFNFDLWIVDVPNNKNGIKRSIQEVLSDTKQIANDLVAYLRYTDFAEGGLNIELPISMVDVISALDDDVSGWNFQIRIKLTNELDLCGIPLTNYTNPEGYLKKAGNTLVFDVNSVYNTYENPETTGLGLSLPAATGITLIMLHSGYIGGSLAPFATLTSGTYVPTSINLMTFTYDGVDVNYTIEQI